MFSDYETRLKGILRTDVDVGVIVQEELRAYIEFRRGAGSAPLETIQRKVLAEIEDVAGGNFTGDAKHIIKRLKNPGKTDRDRALRAIYALHFLTDGIEYARQIERAIIAPNEAGDQRTFAEATNRLPKRRKAAASLPVAVAQLPTCLVFALPDDSKIYAKVIQAVWKGAADIVELRGGDIEEQGLIESALATMRKVDHFIPCVAPAATENRHFKALWSAARQLGLPITPVRITSGEIGDIPDWIIDLDPIFALDPDDLDTLPDRLKRLVQPMHVHYHDAALGKNYVPRPAKQAGVKAQLLSRTNPSVALTTSLKGAGGFGKSVLAEQLCADIDLRAAFHDGVVLLDVGRDKSEGDVAQLVAEAINWISGAPPATHLDPKTAVHALAEAIGEKRVLLVVDDVWRGKQLELFRFDIGPGPLRCPNAALLFTTRLPELSQSAASMIDVDKVELDEAVAILKGDLLVASAADEAAFAKISTFMHLWAQLLAAGHAVLRTAVKVNGQPLPEALASLARLTERHIAWLNPALDEHRNKIFAWTIGLSLAELEEKPLGSGEDRNYFTHGKPLTPNAQRFLELGVFPENEHIPVEAVATLWGATARLTADETDAILSGFNKYGLIRSLILANGVRNLQCHDNYLHFARDELRMRGLLTTSHAAIGRSLLRVDRGRYEAAGLPSLYYWKHVVRHLRDGKLDSEADKLLLDPNWIGGKVAAVGPDILFKDYSNLGLVSATSMVGHAIGLSLSILRRQPDALYFQLWGRLSARDSRLDEFTKRLKVRLFGVLRPIVYRLSSGGSEILRIVGHGAAVTDASFSPDSAEIVTTSNDETARLWSVRTGAELHRFEGHTDAVNCADFSSDGRQVVTASSDGSARLWSVENGREVMRFEGHGGLVLRARFSPTRTCILTASRDKTARLWSVETGEELYCFETQGGSIIDAKFSPDGSFISIVLDNHTSYIISTSTHNNRLRFVGHSSIVNCAEFSADATKIVTASDDSTARIWSTRTGRVILRLEGHAGPVRSAVFSQDGMRVLTASDDGSMRLWSARDGTELIVFEGHGGAVGSALFSPDGKRILSASYDGTARLWSASTGAELQRFEGHGSLVECAAFSRDGSLVATISDDDTVRLWSAQGNSGLPRVTGCGRPLSSVALSPDAESVLTASDDGALQLWSSTTGLERRSYLRAKIPVRSAEFSPDGLRILSVFYDGTASVWDVSTGVELRRFENRGHSILSACFARDGAQILTASRDGTARLWLAESGAMLRLFAGHGAPVLGAAFSPDGLRLLTIAADGVVRTWSARSRGWPQVLKRRGGSAILYADFCSEGLQILTVSAYGTIDIWSSLDGKKRHTLAFDEGRVQSIAVSADGAQVLTASDTGVAIVWSTETGERLQVFAAPKAEICSVAFYDHDRTIITASQDGVVRLWSTENGSEIQQILFDAPILNISVSGGSVVFSDASGLFHVFSGDIASMNPLTSCNYFER